MKKAKILIMMGTLMMVVVCSYFVAGTYAKYTSESAGSATVKVAKWSFAEDNAVTDVKITLDETINERTLVNDRIAPGTSGSFGVNVNSANTEVGVAFSVDINAVGNMPSNLLLYGTQDCETNPGECTYSDPYTVDADTGALTPVVSKTGRLTPNDTVGLDVNVYWVWAYTTGEGAELTANDVEDTTDGTEATPFTFDISITGTQVPPSATDPGVSAFD